MSLSYTRPARAQTYLWPAFGTVRSDISIPAMPPLSAVVGNHVAALYWIPDARLIDRSEMLLNCYQSYETEMKLCIIA